MSPPGRNGWRYVQLARTQHVGDGSAKAVLNALATYADWETGVCIVSQERLAEHTEKGVTTVRAALKKLEAMRFISRRGRGRQGQRLADEITLTLGTADSLPAASAASEQPTTGRFQRTTGKKQASLPAEAAGVTLHSEHALRNTPCGTALQSVLGRAASSIPDIPDGEQVKAATALLQQFNLYGVDGITIERLWLKFREHAEQNGRRIARIDGAWVAWVRGAINIERQRLNMTPIPNTERMRHRA